MDACTVRARLITFACPVPEQENNRSNIIANTNNMDNECTHISPNCPSDGSSLGYAPNLPVSIIFLVLFTIALLCNVVQGLRYKTWTFMVMMCLGSQSEVIGYAGRVLMHYNPYRLSTLVYIFRISGF